MRSLSALPARLVGAILLGLYPFLMHATFMWSKSSAAGKFALWAELAAMAIIFILRFRRWRWVAVPIIALSAVALLLRGTTSDAIVAASGTPFVATYILLLFFFGSSLRPGHTPIVSRLSAKLSAVPLTPSMLRYTRNVTILWSAFFAAQLAICFILLFAASTTVWSLFVNVLNIPLNLTLFALEYAWRRIHQPSLRHHSLADMIRTLASQDGFDMSAVRQTPNAP